MNTSVEYPKILTTDDFFAEKCLEIDGQIDAAFSQVFYEQVCERDQGEWETGDDGEARLMMHRDHLNDAWSAAEKEYAS